MSSAAIRFQLHTANQPRSAGEQLLHHRLLEVAGLVAAPPLARRHGDRALGRRTDDEGGALMLFLALVPLLVRVTRTKPLSPAADAANVPSQGYPRVG
jgi:hypothetical protein